MATIDLSGYNLSELKGLQFDIEKTIKDRQQDEVRKAREQIQAIAQGLGVSIEDLISASSSKSGASTKRGSSAKVDAQYRNPADSSQTWTGRGRQPKWIAEGLAGGKKIEDFRISK
ncbi:MAG: H-NS histone family protein [Halobacteriota archaeon]